MAGTRWTEDQRKVIDVRDKNVLVAAAPAWDGKIEIEEKIVRFAIGGGMNVKKISDVIQMETMELVQRAYTDHMTGRTAISAFCRPVTVE